MNITSQHLRQQTPTAFENLIFDILIYLGLQNVVWRTPASDGGKDITGTFIVNEFSRTSKIQRWNIECKHLSKSVSWKNIVEKIYFGKNDGVDFILIATSATISNQCKDEISKWNKNNCIPQIRYWQACDIVNFIKKNNFILHKYFGVNKQYISFFSDRKLLSLKKLILVAYSDVVSKRTPKSLEAVKSVFELIDDVSCDIELLGDTLDKTNYDDSDAFEFVEVEGVQTGIVDKYIINVVASLIFTYTCCEKIICTPICSGEMIFFSKNKKYDMTKDMVQFITDLVTLKQYSLEFTDDTIMIRKR